MTQIMLPASRSRGPGAFVVEGCAAEESDRAN